MPVPETTRHRSWRAYRPSWAARCVACWHRDLAWHKLNNPPSEDRLPPEKTTVEPLLQTSDQPGEPGPQANARFQQANSLAGQPSIHHEIVSLNLDANQRGLPRLKS